MFYFIIILLCRDSDMNFLLFVFWLKCAALATGVICLFYTTGKLFFSKSTGWISSIKMSQDSIRFSKGFKDFKRLLNIKYFGFNTLLRSPDKSIMLRIVQISGGIGICGKPFETRFKTLFSCFLIICKS